MNEVRVGIALVSTGTTLAGDDGDEMRRNGDEVHPTGDSDPERVDFRREGDVMIILLECRSARASNGRTHEGNGQQ
jgi:hypothetical protein